MFRGNIFRGLKFLQVPINIFVCHMFYSLKSFRGFGVQEMILEANATRDQRILCNKKL